MDIDYEQIGFRIKKEREKKGLSQGELSDLINSSRKYVNYIERGKKNPRVDTLIDIANALGVSADDLLVDSLEHSSSTADTSLHKLLLECNEVEEKILVDLVKYMKTVLYSQGI